MKNKNFLAVVVLSMVLISCAPVLDRKYMQVGERSVSFNALRRAPEQYKGRLFILGGLIVDARFISSGIQIEAVHLAVDSQGYVDEDGLSQQGRFLAVAPKDETTLDPALLRRGGRLTMAGEFAGLREGKIDEMPYLYPVFRIRQIYLWPREEFYRYPPPPQYRDPWFNEWRYPYPAYDFYGDMWWRYP